MNLGPLRTVLGAVLLASCSSTASIAPSTTTTVVSTHVTAETTTTAVETTTTAGRNLSALTADDSGYIFDQERLHTFELTLSDEALAQIDRNPSAEEWVLGSLTFEGETIDRVGIRYKGSIGAWVGCLSDPDWTDPSGHKVCTKLSMKVKVNWDDSNREFHGLRRLQFHNMNLDPSQMHERLGYWLFREMGVPAPRSVHARLIVNGTYVGVFALTEQIDGRFTRHNFDDGTGNLYKEVWPLHVGYVTGDLFFVEALRTNEDENPSIELIKNFGSEVKAAGPDGAAEVVDRWMDVDEVLAWAVVDRTIRNDDGPFHWYCFGECRPHNYYWYEEPTAGTLHLIPWDLDNAFQNIVKDSNPVTPVADAWGEITRDCQRFGYGDWGLLQRSAACDPVFAAWATFDDDYRRLLDEFLDGPFAEELVT
ncbi:MAG: CotH kinase family protein, partial [Actinomycetota bacterium]|nr:CotH kinase family protein [Actinomycetota bacterium]